MIRRILFVLFFLIVPFISARADIVTGLVGWWRLDETGGTSARDASGKGNTGTLQPGGGPPTWVSGRLDGALLFDGVDDRVSLGSAPTLEMGTGAVTVAHWINSNTLTGGFQSLFFGGGGGGGRGYGTKMSNALFGYEVYGVTGDRQNFAFSPGFQQGQWIHIVAVFDGVNNLMAAYMNGILKHATGITDPGDVQNTGSFYIGSHAGSGWYFNGLMDDVRLYNRALTQADVTELYNNGGPTRVRNAVIRSGAVR